MTPSTYLIYIKPLNRAHGEFSGVKLSFHSIEPVEAALLVLKSVELGSRPVWLEANIIKASGQEPVLDSNK